MQARLKNSKEVELVDWELSWESMVYETIADQVPFCFEKMEMHLGKFHSTLPNVPGVYVITCNLESRLRILYVGRASLQSISFRWRSHHVAPKVIGLLQIGISVQANCITFPVPSDEVPKFIKAVEANLIHKYCPCWNERQPEISLDSSPSQSIELIKTLGILDLLDSKRIYRNSDNDLIQLRQRAFCHQEEVSRILGFTVGKKNTSPISIFNRLIRKLGLQSEMVGKEGRRGQQERLWALVGYDGLSQSNLLKNMTLNSDIEAV